MGLAIGGGGGRKGKTRRHDAAEQVQHTEGRQGKAGGPRGVWGGACVRGGEVGQCMKVWARGGVGGADSGRQDRDQQRGQDRMGRGRTRQGQGNCRQAFSLALLLPICSDV